jgi:hypothetical protein
VHEREQRQLETSYEEPVLLCGTAFASESLSTQLKKFKAGNRIEPRKKRRMELAWLGYLARACSKPSPFSVLARVGLGFLVNDPRECGLVPGPGKLHSLVRIKRYIIDQCFLQLLNEPEFLLTLNVEVNNTLHRLEQGTCQFLVPGKWTIHNSQVYTFSVESIVKMKLSEDVWEILEKYRESEPTNYTRLLQDLECNLNLSRPESIDLVSNMLNAGLLLVLSPWTSNSASLESGLLRHLQGNKIEKLASVQSELANLCNLEQSCVVDLNSMRNNGSAIVESLNALWKTVHAVIPSQTRANYTPIRSVVKHDSFFVSSDTPKGEVGYLLQQGITKAFSAIEPLETISNLFWSGFDFQHTLAAATKNAVCENIPLEPFLSQTRSIWQEYAAYELATRSKSLLKEPFNPCNLEIVEKLYELRQKMWEQLHSSLTVNSDCEVELVSSVLSQLSQHIPVEYRPILPCGLFLQPIGHGMENWVLNNASESAGRVVSRFVHIMPEVTRKIYSERAVRCSTWVKNDRRLALLDVSSIFGEVLNVHPILSHYVLEMPGERFDLTRERRLRLKDISVCLNDTSPMPWVRSPRNDHLLPVHMGGAGYDFVASSTIRQLCMLGPSRQLPFIPEGLASETRDVHTFSRVTLGNLVLRRRCWWVRREQLPNVTTTGPDADFYLAFNKWRVDAQIPTKAFVRLDVDFDPVSGRHKPQYIDFSSPLFLRMFASMIQNHTGKVRFEEVLPAIEFDNEANDGHVFEVFVDPLFFHSIDPTVTGMPC